MMLMDIATSLKRCPPRHVHVQTQSGSVYTFMVERDAKTSVLKRLLSEKLGVSPEQAVLTYKGQVLADDLNSVCEDGPILLKSKPMKRSVSSSCLTPTKSGNASSLQTTLSISTSTITETASDFAESGGIPSDGSSYDSPPSGSGSQTGLAGLSVAAPEERLSASILEEAPGPSPCPFVVVGSSRCAKAVKHLVRAMVEGVKAGQSPKPEIEGHGGTYFFTDAVGNKVALVKPTDEEPLAPNNPKGFVGRQLGDPGLKKSVRVGEAALREAAAFLLDHDGFARVPRTALVKARHPVFHINPTSMLSARLLSESASSHKDTVPTKLASLQEFAPHDYDASEHSTSRFAVTDVHRLGILDIRLFNTDRHSGNILVRKKARSRGRGGAPGALTRVASLGVGMGADALGGGATTPARARSGLRLADFQQDEELQLIPIDHGYCLPESVDAVYFEWLYWPQAAQPFGEEELAYIAALDVKEEMAMLRRELPMLREESLRMLELSTHVLQRSASYGLSLAEIGNILSRPLSCMDEEPSEMELMCYQALTQMREQTQGPERALGPADADADGSDTEGSWVGVDGEESDADESLSAGSDCAEAAGYCVPVQRFGTSLMSGGLARLVEVPAEEAAAAAVVADEPAVQQVGWAPSPAKGFIVRRDSLRRAGLGGSSDLNSSYRNLMALDRQYALFELDEKASSDTASSPSQSLSSFGSSGHLASAAVAPSAPTAAVGGLSQMMQAALSLERSSAAASAAAVAGGLSMGAGGDAVRKSWADVDEEEEEEEEGLEQGDDDDGMLAGEMSRGGSFTSNGLGMDSGGSVGGDVVGGSAQARAAARRKLWGDSDADSEEEGEESAAAEVELAGMSLPIPGGFAARPPSVATRPPRRPHNFSGRYESGDSDNGEEAPAPGVGALASSMLNFKGFAAAHHHQLPRQGSGSGGGPTAAATDKKAKVSALSRLTGAHARLGRGPSGTSKRTVPTVCLGDMDERKYGIFRAALAKQVEAFLKGHKWKLSLKLVTEEGTRLQNNFGTSCPRF